MNRPQENDRKNIYELKLAMKNEDSEGRYVGNGYYFQCDKKEDIIDIVYDKHLHTVMAHIFVELTEVLDISEEIQKEIEIIWHLHNNLREGFKKDRVKEIFKNNILLFNIEQLEIY